MQGEGGWGIAPHPLLGNVVHTFDFLYKHTHSRKWNAHKNVTFSKLLMHFQLFKGPKFQKIFQGSMPPDPLSLWLLAGSRSAPPLQNALCDPWGHSLNEAVCSTVIDELHCVCFPACIQHNVPHLIYTSTYNVVFGGQVIRGGDEQLPYLPLDKVCIWTLFPPLAQVVSKIQSYTEIFLNDSTVQHLDHYSRTKSIAEQAVLKANGCLLSGRLQTKGQYFYL